MPFHHAGLPEDQAATGNPRSAGRRLPGTAAANILLLKVLEDLAAALHGTPLMALKGAALLLTGAREPDERPMEDLDVLVRPGDKGRAVRALDGLGFRKVPADPCLFSRDGLAVDLHDGIWYLEDEGMAGFWARARSVAVGPGRGPERRVLVPAPRDLLAHVLAHAAVHHAEPDPKWAGDVRGLLAAFPELERPDGLRRELAGLGLEPAASQFLEAAAAPGSEVPSVAGERDLPASAPVAGRPPDGLRLRAWSSPHQGHLLRLWYLPGWRRRLAFAWRTLFPDEEFLKLRYDAGSRAAVVFWRFARPACLAAKALHAAWRLRPRSIHVDSNYVTFGRNMSRDAAGGLESRLARVLLDRPEVAFAYLFGSLAKGGPRPDSDLDVAVWIGARGADLAGVKLDLTGAIGSALGMDRVDVAILNSAPASLRYVVQKEGRLLFERRPGPRIAFECRARSDYWDWEPRLKVYAAHMLRRLEEGTYGA